MATPTTLPASFVSGAVLTAAQLNNLRGAFRILQIATVSKTDTFSTTSTSFVDVTGLSVSITPRESTSQILIMFNAIGGSDTNNTVNRVNFVRGSTTIGQSTGGASNATMTFTNGDSIQSKTWNGHFIDSPATTSATTYKVQIATNGGTVFVGRRAAADDRAISSLTVMEISA
jgi:hypothetical protein